MKPPVICVGTAVDVEHFPGGRKPFPLTAVRKVARACSMLRSAPTYSAQYRELDLQGLQKHSSEWQYILSSQSNVTACL